MLRSRNVRTDRRRRIHSITSIPLLYGNRYSCGLSPTTFNELLKYIFWILCALRQKSSRPCFWIYNRLKHFIYSNCRSLSTSVPIPLYAKTGQCPWLEYGCSGDDRRREVLAREQKRKRELPECSGRFFDGMQNRTGGLKS